MLKLHARQFVFQEASRDALPTPAPGRIDQQAGERSRTKRQMHIAQYESNAGNA